MTTESQLYNCFTRIGGNAIPKHSGPKAKSSNPTAGLTLLWAGNPFRELLTTGNSHGKKPDRFSLKNVMDVEKVSGFKYASCNIRGLGEKEEYLDEILNESNIIISVITESKKKLQEPKQTEHYTVIFSGVDRHTRGQSAVMLWINKSVSNEIDHYKFWYNRVIEIRLETQRGHLTILAVCAPTECRDELNEILYETIQDILG